MAKINSLNGTIGQYSFRSSESTAIGKNKINPNKKIKIRARKKGKNKTAYKVTTVGYSGGSSGTYKDEDKAVNQVVKDAKGELTDASQDTKDIGKNEGEKSKENKSVKDSLKDKFSVSQDSKDRIKDRLGGLVNLAQDRDNDGEKVDDFAETLFGRPDKKKNSKKEKESMDNLEDLLFGRPDMENKNSKKSKKRKSKKSKSKKSRKTVNKSFSPDTREIDISIEIPGDVQTKTSSRKSKSNDPFDFEDIVGNPIDPFEDTRSSNNSSNKKTKRNDGFDDIVGVDPELDDLFDF